MIWSRCPKNIFIHKGSFELGVNSAVLYFNEGAAGVQRDDVDVAGVQRVMSQS